MIKSKYEKFFYFRSQVDEDHDDDSAASIMLPVNCITGILPVSTTLLRIYFDQGTSVDPLSETLQGQNGYLDLAVTANKSKDVIEALVEAANSSAPSDGVILVADDSTTDFDGTTRLPKYLHADIVGINGNIFNR
jgi:hypothetical protein